MAGKDRSAAGTGTRNAGRWGRMLEVKDLNVSYGAVHAIHGISLEVHEGEIVSLIGPMGLARPLS